MLAWEKHNIQARKATALLNRTSISMQTSGYNKGQIDNEVTGSSPLSGNITYLIRNENVEDYH